MTQTQFDPENIVLDEEEQWIEDHLDEYVPVENQENIRVQMMAAARKPPKIIYDEQSSQTVITLQKA